jgi:gliding motility-associated-like protein
MPKFALKTTTSKWSVFACFCLFFVAINGLKAQSGSGCNNPISLNFPFNVSNINSCNFANNYTGQNGCLPPAAINPYAGSDVFFTFTPSTTGYLNLQLFGVTGDGNIRPRLYLFTGCPSSGGICVNALIGNTNPNGASVILTVFEGVTYYIVVDAAMNNAANSASCFTFNLQGSLQPVPVDPGCTNMDFGTGDFSGWTGTTGRSVATPPGSPTPDYLIQNIGFVNNRHTIMSDGVDPCGGFPRVDPLGAPYSLRLGNSNVGAQGEAISQTFVVTEQNSSLTYRYAVVFQDPNHPSHQQPFFRAIVKDQNGNTVPCSDFIVSAAAGLPGFFNSPNCNNVRYKPWSTVNVDLSIFAGQNVTIEFTTGDCTPSGHYGYAYIDAFCSPSTLNALGDTICIGESVSMAAPDGYSSYLWLPMNDNSQSITITPNESMMVTLVLTSFNGCVSTYDIPIIVTFPPDVSFNYTPDNCDTPVIFENTSTVNIGSMQSFWDFGAGAQPQTSTQINPGVVFPGPGSYPVKLIQTTAGGCVDSVIQTITVPDCFFEVRVQADTICANACTELAAEVFHGIPPFQFSWSTGSTDSVITVCPSTSSNYIVTVTDAFGGTFSDTVEIIISPSVFFNPDIRHISCNGLSDGSIEVNPVGFGPFAFAWDNGTSFSIIDNLNAGNYALSITDAFGCISDSAMAIIEPDTISFSYVTVEPTCNVNTGEIEIINVLGGTPGYSYSIGNGIFVPNPVFDQLAEGNYLLIVRDTNLCDTQIPLPLFNTNSPIGMQLALNNATCGESNGSIEILGVNGGVGPFRYVLQGGSETPIASFPFAINSLNGINYNLSIIDANECVIDTSFSLLQMGAPETLQAVIEETSCGEDNGSIAVNLIGGVAPIEYRINGGAYQTNPLFENLPAGTYLIEIRDANDCMLDRTVEIEDSDGVGVNIQLISGIACHNDTTGALTVNILGGSAPYDVEWSNDEDGPQINLLPAGTYSVTVIDDNGCEATDEIVLINPAQLTVSIVGDTSYCQGDVFMLQADVQGAQGDVLHDWNNGFATTASAQFLADSAFQVQINVTDANQCSASDEVSITIFENPAASIFSDLTENCGPECVNYALNITSTAPIVAYFWNSDNHPPGMQQDFKICYNESGTYGVDVTLTNVHGCSTLVIGQNLVTIHPLPIADFMADPSKTTILQAEIQFYEQSTGTDFFLWSFGDSNFSEDENPLHTYKDTGWFNVCLKTLTQFACIDSVCKQIYIEAVPTFYAPNSFSPNNDGVNDVFKLYFTYVKDFRIEIFNRWGELIFVSEDPELGWDGTYKGKRAQSDVYIWKAVFTNSLRETQNLIGKVTLFR